VVEERLRVYAEKWRVWADAPVGERYESTPYWAYRRWPAEVVGVVTTPTIAGPMVVTQWSDGEVIALDARKGEIAWRATAPIAPLKYDGRRTGASVVYEPRSLLTARTGNQTAIVAVGPQTLSAFDATTGAVLWQRNTKPGCEPAPWTGSGLVVVPDCDGQTIILYSASDGIEKGHWVSPEKGFAPAPSLCEMSRFECRLVTLGGVDAWILSVNGRLTAVPPLEPGALLAGERVVYPTAKGVAARPLGSRDPLWTWDGVGTLIAADAIGVYVLTDDRTVLGLSPATGHLVVVGCASSQPNDGWRIAHVHPTGGSYLVLERVTNEPPTAKDQQYFYGPRPVALVELYTPTKLPVWAGKFAACRPV